jgi:hypothetical protein
MKEILDSCKLLSKLPKHELEPRQFLRHCFGIAELSSKELLEEETNSLYRRKCVTVLSTIFDLQRPTVCKWGNDLNFEGIPNYCKFALAYIHVAEITPKHLSSILKGEYNPPLVEAQTFLEKILLSGFTEQQVLQTLSHSNFRATYIKTLTSVLHVSSKSVQNWGLDISLSKMPKIHKHTLGYALEALQRYQKQYTKLEAVV